MIEAPASLEVVTLGRFAVRRHHDLLSGGNWNRRKVVDLFKLLITAEQHRLHREQIQETLWPSAADEQAASSFGKTLYLLRRALEPELARGAASTYLSLDHDVLQLIPESIGIDADRFESAVKQLQVVARNHSIENSNAPPDNPDLLNEFDRVLNLYQGDYLPEDLYEDWSQRRRDRLRRMHSWLLEHAAMLAVAGKMGQRASEYLQALLEHDAADEQTHRLLMLVYARMGRRNEALYQFHLLQETLRDELRTQPLSETLDLYHAIQAGRIVSDLAPALSLPPERAFETMGAGRLFPQAEDVIARPRSEEKGLLATESAAEERQEAGSLLEIPGSDLLQGVLVEREEEMQRLQRLHAHVHNGSGGSAVIYGEPGIGKTRLAREFMRWIEAERAGVVFWGGCYEMAGSLPYHPFIEALTAFVHASSDEELRHLFLSSPQKSVAAHAEPPQETVAGMYANHLARIVPELRHRLPVLVPMEPGEPELERSNLFAAVAHFFNMLAMERSVVIILDDLQWADTATIQLLSYLMLAPVPSLSSASRPLYMLLYRSNEVHESHALRGLLASLTRFRKMEELRLKRLSEEAVKQLLVELAGHDISAVFVNEIYKHTEGNPFFLGETLISLLHEGKVKNVDGQWQTMVSLDELALPQSIRLLIERRLLHLSPECRTTLALAAVLGRQFSSELLCTARKLSEESVAEHMDDAIRLHILSPLRTSKGHSSHRVRQMEADLAFTHDKIREVLYQWLNPLRRRTMHRQVAQAIEQHASLLDTYAGSLAYHYQMAEDYTRAVDYFLKAARHASEVYAFAYAAEYMEKALELLIGDEDRQKRAALLQHLAEEAYLYIGRPDKAIEAGLASCALWRSLGDVEKGAETRLDVAFAFHWQGREVEAIESIQHALECLQKLPESIRLHSKAHAQWGMSAVNIGDTLVAREQLQLAEQLHEQLGGHDPFISVVMLWSWSWYCWLTGSLQDMLSYALRAAQACRESYNLGWEPMATYAAAWAYMQLGQTEEGQQMAIETLEKAKRHNAVGAQGWAYLVLSFTSMQRGRWEESPRYAEKAMEIAHMLSDQDLQARVLWSRSICSWYQHDWDHAINTICEAIAILQQEGAASMVYPYLQAQAAVAYLSAGYHERAQHYLDEAWQIARERGYQQLIVICKQIQAGIWQRLDRFDEAEQLFSQALDEAQQRHDPLQYHLALAASGRFYLARNREGDPARGQELIERARTFFKGIAS
jgi:predicted ATPase/DNA-binding SARP family transcriptional activator